MFLIQAPDDIGRDADEGAERRGALDAVLPAVPGGAEDLRHLLQIVDEELLRLLAEGLPLAPGAERLPREQLLQLLRERRLRDTAAAHAEQLDLAVERRIFPVVQRAHDVVCRRQVLVAIQLTAG